MPLFDAKPIHGGGEVIINGDIDLRHGSSLPRMEGGSDGLYFKSLI